MMKPIYLEIVTRVVTTFDHCHHCEILFDEAGIDRKSHENDMNEYPLDLREEFIKLSDWIRELARLYKHRLLIKLIDVQSLLGIYKSLRYWIRAYPTFIVEGEETYTGWDKNQLEGLLDRYMKASLLSKHRSIKPSLPQCISSNTSLHYFRSRHSCEGRNPVLKHWIPGQARNDKQSKGTFDTLH